MTIELKETDEVESIKKDGYDVTAWNPKEGFKEWFFDDRDVFLNGKKLNEEDGQYVLSVIFEKMMGVVKNES